jgi:hypothetical protein
VVPDSATLTLIPSAKNMTQKAIADMKADLGSVGSKAKIAAKDFSESFKNAGRTAASGIGNIISDVLRGQDLSRSLTDPHLQ